MSQGSESIGGSPASSSGRDPLAPHPRSPPPYLHPSSAGVQLTPDSKAVQQVQAVLNSKCTLLVWANDLAKACSGMDISSVTGDLTTVFRCYAWSMHAPTQHYISQLQPTLHVLCYHWS